MMYRTQSLAAALIRDRHNDSKSGSGRLTANFILKPRRALDLERGGTRLRSCQTGLDVAHGLGPIDLKQPLAMGARVRFE
jgi:hypothetical protein